MRDIKLWKNAGIATAALATALAAMPAWAQTTQADDVQVTDQEIVVTGSRIRRSPLDQAKPVTTVDEASIARTGLSSVADVLQRLPSAGGGLNTKVNNAGNIGGPPDGTGVSSGSAEIDLRYLAAKRTLVVKPHSKRANSASLGMGPTSAMPSLRAALEGLHATTAARIQSAGGGGGMEAGAHQQTNSGLGPAAKAAGPVTNELLLFAVHGEPAPVGEHSHCAVELKLYPDLRSDPGTIFIRSLDKIFVTLKGKRQILRDTALFAKGEGAFQRIRMNWTMTIAGTPWIPSEARVVGFHEARDKFIRCFDA